MKATTILLSLLIMSITATAGITGLVSLNSMVKKCKQKHAAELKREHIASVDYYTAKNIQQKDAVQVHEDNARE